MQKIVYKIVLGLIFTQQGFSAEWITPGISEEGNFATRNYYSGICEDSIRKEALSNPQVCYNDKHMASLKKLCDYERFLNEKLGRYEEALWDFHILYSQTSSSNSEIKKEIKRLKKKPLVRGKNLDSKNISVFEARTKAGGRIDQTFSTNVDSVKNKKYDFNNDSSMPRDRLVDKNTLQSSVKIATRNYSAFLTSDDVSEIQNKILNDFEEIGEEIGKYEKIQRKYFFKSISNMTWPEIEEMGQSFQGIYKILLDKSRKLAQLKNEIAQKVPVWGDSQEYTKCIDKKYPECEEPRADKKHPCDVVKETKQCLRKNPTGYPPVECVLQNSLAGSGGSDRDHE